jgi:hypothetical protein
MLKIHMSKKPCDRSVVGRLSFQFHKEFFKFGPGGSLANIIRACRKPLEVSYG